MVFLYSNHFSAECLKLFEYGWHIQLELAGDKSEEVMVAFSLINQPDFFFARWCD